MQHPYEHISHRAFIVIVLINFREYFNRQVANMYNTNIILEKDAPGINIKETEYGRTSGRK